MNLKGHLVTIFLLSGLLIFFQILSGDILVGLAALGLFIALLLTLRKGIPLYVFSAKKINGPKHFFLEEMIQNTSYLSNIKCPSVYFVQDSNFALLCFGHKNKSHLIVNEEIVKKLGTEELRALVFYEMLIFKKLKTPIREWGTIVFFLFMKFAKVLPFSLRFVFLLIGGPIVCALRITKDSLDNSKVLLECEKYVSKKELESALNKVHEDEDPLLDFGHGKYFILGK